ncbi:AMP-dependent synthetase and ligase [Ferrimonas balearica DSM 9799]|uniref:AMP-dependent synthetase and ligase n=1 Tax=Ferrimonas balearica (strain DSM 9799 / CCM 4581 / KCTC 23876 / PAT) TaxID=550540 RepID=E1SR42_FERBD|nr:AMP-dependent synthetase and ligase [Ferrimonas balearica DSM 9799]
MGKRVVKPSLEQLHLVPVLRQRIAQLGDAPALRHQVAGQWQDISWKRFGEQLDALSRALLALGVEVQDKVAIFAQNCAEWAIADVASMQCRAVIAPIYPTNTDEQAAYIINDAGAKVLFVAGEEQYAKALALVAHCPTLQHIVLMDDALQVQSCEVTLHHMSALIDAEHSQYQAELEQRIADRRLDDLLTLIYTSGTTGEPKGVMLDYTNFASTVRQHAQFLPFGVGDVSLAFLPLSHVFERGWSLYVLTQGGTNAYLADPMAVQDALAEIRPHVMCAVPRLYEKIYSAVMEKLEQAPAHKRGLFMWALKQGLKRFEAEQGGPAMGAFGRAKLALADKLVLSKVREKLGGRIRFMPAGGAALDPVVNQFFQSVGLTVLCGFGMTETTASVTANRMGEIGIGTNGSALPEVQVKIGANDEILVKGDTVMRGYYNRPQDTAEAFDEDGWLKTGDCGYLDAQGRLLITDRIKELMKTSNGKYIAPQRVEGMVSRDPLVEQVAIIADARNYVSALIVPAFEALEHWAREVGIQYKDKLELVNHATVKAHFEERLKAVQAELARFEQVKQFTLLPREFCMKRGELTPTMKLRRKVINQRFAKEIEAMYRKVAPAKA